MPLYDHKSQTAFLNRRLAAGKLLFTALLTAGALIALPLMSASPALASGAGSDILGPDQALYGGQALTSANGQYSLAMQEDGNLVVYDACHSPLWYTGKLTGQNVPGSYVVMQPDGNFVLYSPSNQPLWYTGLYTKNSPGAYVVMQSDGNFVLYSASNQALWWTGTTGSCSGTSILGPGQALYGGQSLPSANGQYSLAMQQTETSSFTTQAISRSGTRARRPAKTFLVPTWSCSRTETSSSTARQINRSGTRAS